MANIRLRYADMANVADQIHDASVKMTEIFNEITNICNKNIGEAGEAWSGDAAVAARANFDRFFNRFQEFSSAVQSCETKIRSVVANYQSGDQIHMQ